MDLSIKNLGNSDDVATTLFDMLDEEETHASVQPHDGKEFGESSETFTGNEINSSEEKMEVPIEPPNSEVAYITDVVASTSSGSKMAFIAAIKNPEDVYDVAATLFNMFDQVETHVSVQPHDGKEFGESSETLTGNEIDSLLEQIEVLIEPPNSEVADITDVVASTSSESKMALSIKNWSNLDDVATTDTLDQVETHVSVQPHDRKEFGESSETFTGNEIDSLEEQMEVPIEPPNSEITDITDVVASTSSESKVVGLRGGGKRKTSKKSSKGKSFKKVKVQSDEEVKFDQEAAPKAKKNSNIDIFGNEITTTYLNKFKTNCPHCKKTVQAKGFVRHLQSCMGLNTRSGRSGGSNKA